MTDTAPAPLPASPPRRRGPLRRNPALRLLWTGESASALGTSVATVALPLVAVGLLHATAAQMGFLEAVTWLPWLVAGLPAGAWADRWPPRLIMLACDGVSLLAFWAVAAARDAGFLSFGVLLGVAVTAGTASVFFTTAYPASLLMPLARPGAGLLLCSRWPRSSRPPESSAPPSSPRRSASGTARLSCLAGSPRHPASSVSPPPPRAGSLSGALLLFSPVRSARDLPG